MVQELSSDRSRPLKEVDVDLLVFVERYVTNLLKWDLVTLFAQNPEAGYTLARLAQSLGRSGHVVRPELGDLIWLGVLERSAASAEPTYRLTTDPALRGLALKFAKYMATP